jgi:hypothetical protein
LQTEQFDFHALQTKHYAPVPNKVPGMQLKHVVLSEQLTQGELQDIQEPAYT